MSIPDPHSLTPSAVTQAAQSRMAALLSAAHEVFDCLLTLLTILLPSSVGWCQPAEPGRAGRNPREDQEALVDGPRTGCEKQHAGRAGVAEASMI